jgi:hypothetical protein
MLLASLSAAPPALGQTATDSATAETLFNEALALLEKERFAEACAKLEASQTLDPGVGTLLYLADCYQQVGRTASAWATFREAAYMAKGKADERESVAIDHARELEPELSYLTVTIASPATPGLELKHNGKPLSSALWGSAFPVDPGAHTVEASAPGKKAWSQTLNVAAGPRRDMLLVPELVAAAPEPVIVEPRMTAPPSSEATGDAQTTVGWVLLGVGSAAVVTGGVFALLARSDDTSAEAECRPDRVQLCGPAGVELGESAETKATVAGLSAGLGLAALGAGVTLLLTAPDRDARPELRVQATVVDQRGFVSVTSTW